MRLHMDDAERALLAPRLGHPESVADADLAASLAAWVQGGPQLPGGRRLTPADLDDINAVADWSDVDDAQPGGYANNQTGWIGAG